MAIIRILMVVGLVFLVACGDSADSGGGGDSEARCEGESLLINYKECVGDEAYEDEWAELSLEAANRDSGWVDPEPGEVNVYTCGTDTGVAHFCNYEEGVSSAECIWDVWDYAGEGSKKVMGCICAPSYIENSRGVCD